MSITRVRAAHRGLCEPPACRAFHTKRGTVGLLVMRSYVLAGNTGHYDGVIAEFEARGLRVIPAFATGLDARPAVERFFMNDGKATVDAVVSLTGFSLVGGPAYNDARAAEEMLAALDVPYIAAHSLEFQTLEHWEASERGLVPVEATMMVAIPELDGATGPMIFGGRSASAVSCDSARHAGPPGARKDAGGTGRQAGCTAAFGARRTRVAIVLFNFPPNVGRDGDRRVSCSVRVAAPHAERAARCGVHGRGASYRRCTARTRSSAGMLRATAPTRMSVRASPPTNTCVAIAGWRTSKPSGVRRQADSRADGASIFVLGERFGNVLVGIQPAFGYEGDPMRLLFERGFAPTHAFSAFYRYLREDFAAIRVLHFGTHGALEFMPGKQVGLSAACWPDRLIGDLPNIYLYAANNPSEGTHRQAPRRGDAGQLSDAAGGARRTLSRPCRAQGVDRALAGAAAGGADERGDLAALIQAQAAELELATPEPAWAGEAETEVRRSPTTVLELEHTLIPHGLHVVGQTPTPEERVDMLLALAAAAHGGDTACGGRGARAGDAPEAAVRPHYRRRNARDARRARRRPTALLARESRDPRTSARARRPLRSPGAGWRPAAQARDPADRPQRPRLRSLPHSERLRGADGARQAERLLERHAADGNALPETVALVLWGTDNLKSEGGPIAQALALIGARPRFDSYGRLARRDARSAARSWGGRGSTW